MWENRVPRMGGRPWRRLRSEILKRDNGICFYCGVHGATHVDHLTPISRGGTDSSTNLAACCKRCNLRKGEKTADEFIRKQQMKRFFDTADTPPTPATNLSLETFKSPFIEPERLA